MNRKKLGKALLFPHIAVMILLVPVATAFLICSMVFFGTESPVAIISYVLAAYTLTVWCFKIPHIIRFFKKIKRKNKLVRRWREDARLRINVSLYGALIWNSVYAVFQLWLGIYHHTFWFCSLAVYYVLLAVMRFFLARHTRRFAPGERMRAELRRYCACGWIFLVMNLALALMIFFMVYWNRTFRHHEITKIMMAAYTFTSFVLAIVGMVKYRKYQSPVYSASKAISFAAACVSMLTLESTMLTTWGEGEGEAFRRIMLALTGGVISLVIIVMAAAMIVKGSRELKKWKIEKRTEKN